MRSRPLRYALTVLAVAAMSTGLVTGLLYVPATEALLTRLEYTACDRFLFAMRGSLPPPGEIVVIGIDAASVRELGTWPFPRSYHAEVIRRLKAWGARVIVFDVVFDLPRADAPEGDRELIAACREAGNVVVAANTEEVRDAARGDQNALYEPFPALDAVTDTGMTNFYKEMDRTVRRAVVLQGAAGIRYPLLAIAGAALFLGDDPAKVAPGRVLRLGRVEAPLDDEGTFWINFAGPAGHVPRLSYWQVLDDPADQPTLPSLVKDRLVFIGSTDPLQHDVHLTPYGQPETPGVEIHANVANMLLHNQPLRRLGSGWVPGITALLALGLGAASAAGRPFRAALYLALTLVLFVFAAALVFKNDGIWPPLVAPALGAGVAYIGGVLYRYLVVDRERRQVRSLFSKYVSRDVAHALIEDPNAAELGSSKKLPVTCLFSDIRGFTSISERLQPEEVVAMLNEYFERMVDCVFEHRGTLDKYVGDAIMATYGVPKSFGNDAERACRTAVRMREELVALQAKWAAEGKTGIDIGIGINTGDAIVGNIGSEARREFTCIGDTINTASRLEGLNKDLGTKMLIGDSTYEEIKDLNLFAVRKLPPAAVKGKAEAVQIYELLGWRKPGEQAPPC
ncbi:MAG: adenylate/guanylate cyclase domain-containing protein [Armatimonadetes bacterium]|nr:adenylate/guanylate cyclase domain-containing protein [Armatimonadota bacterium]